MRDSGAPGYGIFTANYSVWFVFLLKLKENKNNQSSTTCIILTVMNANSAPKNSWAIELRRKYCASIGQ